MPDTTTTRIVSILAEKLLDAPVDVLVRQPCDRRRRRRTQPMA